MAKGPPWHTPHPHSHTPIHSSVFKQSCSARAGASSPAADRQQTRAASFLLCGRAGENSPGAACKRSPNSQDDDGSRSLAGLPGVVLDLSSNNPLLSLPSLLPTPSHTLGTVPTHRAPQQTPLQMPTCLVSESSLQELTLQYSPFWKALQFGEDSSKGCRTWC